MDKKSARERVWCFSCECGNARFNGEGREGILSSDGINGGLTLGAVAVPLREVWHARNVSRGARINGRISSSSASPCSRRKRSGTMNALPLNGSQEKREKGMGCECVMVRACFPLVRNHDAGGRPLHGSRPEALRQRFVTCACAT